MEEWNERSNGIQGTHGRRNGINVQRNGGKPRNGANGEVGLPHGRKNGMNTQRNGRDEGIG